MDGVDVLPLTVGIYAGVELAAHLLIENILIPYYSSA